MRRLDLLTTLILIVLGTFGYLIVNNHNGVNADFLGDSQVLDERRELPYAQKDTRDSDSIGISRLPFERREDGSNNRVRDQRRITANLNEAVEGFSSESLETRMSRLDIEPDTLAPVRRRTTERREGEQRRSTRIQRRRRARDNSDELEFRNIDDTFIHEFSDPRRDERRTDERRNDERRREEEQRRREEDRRRENTEMDTGSENIGDSVDTFVRASDPRRDARQSEERRRQDDQRRREEEQRRQEQDRRRESDNLKEDEPVLNQSPAGRKNERRDDGQRRDGRTNERRTSEERRQNERRRAQDMDTEFVMEKTDSEIVRLSDPRRDERRNEERRREEEQRRRQEEDRRRENTESINHAINGFSSSRSIRGESQMNLDKNFNGDNGKNYVLTVIFNALALAYLLPIMGLINSDKQDNEMAMKNDSPLTYLKDKIQADLKFCKEYFSGDNNKEKDATMTKAICT